MPLVEARSCALVVIDFQARLMPAIDQGEERLSQARRLIAGARILEVPLVYTEQYPQGLGPTVPELAPGPDEPVQVKRTFDACLAPGFTALLPAGRDLVVIGAETHVCVLQTVMGLRARGRRVILAADAVGSRSSENRELGLRRMEREGAELASVEMVLFEWLKTSEHPRFREVSALIK